MEMQKILRMKEGDGEFSYARNSSVQRTVLTRVTKPMAEDAIRSMLPKDVCEVLNVADLGCGVGPTPVTMITMVIEIVQKMCRELKLKDDQMPQIQMYMNDLPSNDFNLLFRDIRELQLPKQDVMPLCFVMAAPGSFYNQLFPKNCLHLVHSNYAIHWISQVPLGIYDEEGNSMNKGCIIVSEASPPSVVKAYRAQFQQDFSLFLKSRSHEVAENGHMILSVLGTPSMLPTHHWSANLLYQAISNLVLKGIITREKADSFDMPLHYPCKEEMCNAVREEGSFAIVDLKTVAENVAEEIEDVKARANVIAKGIRAAVEVLVSHHFGEQILEVLFDELNQITLLHLEREPLLLFGIILMLKKNRLTTTDSQY